MTEKLTRQVFMLFGAYVSLVASLQLHYLFGTGLAVVLLVASASFAGMALLHPTEESSIPSEDGLDALLVQLVLVALAAVMAMSVTHLADFLELGRGIVMPLAATLGVVAFLHARFANAGWLRFLLAGLFLVVGAVFITGDRDVANRVDVFVFQDLGARYLLAGDNPYVASYPNVYSPEETKAFYGPGLADEKEVKFGYPYTPLSLILVLPGHIVADDFRFSHLVAVGMSIVLLGSPRFGSFGRLGGSLLAIYPLGYFVLTGGWTEPVQILLLIGTAFAFIKRGTISFPVMFGLLLASKLTLAVLAPLYFLFDRVAFGVDGRMRRAGLVLSTALLVTLPLALWDLPRFWFSVVELQLLQPFRADALSVLVWFGNTVGPVGTVLSVSVPFAAAVGGLWWAWRRIRATPFHLIAATAFVYLVWLMFTKQSFLNHYYFAMGALCLGIAVASWCEIGTGDWLIRGGRAMGDRD